MRKSLCFWAEGLHSGASSLFLYGEPFYARARFGWTSAQILLSQALSGACIAAGAHMGGQIAHRRDPVLALRLALVGTLCGYIIGLARAGSHPEAHFLFAFVVIALFQACAWPAVETLLVENEGARRIQNLVGYFNLLWSGATAMVFLAATPLMNRFGFPVVFASPILLTFGAIAACERIAWIRRSARLAGSIDSPESVELPTHTLTDQQRAAFRWLGWLANPFAYVAINTLVAYLPATRERLHLSFASASIWLSLWFYVRSLAFELLRQWSGWHYRWPLLCAVFAATMASFAAIVLAPSIGILLAAQVVFGLGVGLLYQSSLFYSMAESNSQGEHGGFHETFIGLGIIVGPMAAYAGSTYAPHRPAIAVLGVIGLMAIGLAAMLRIGSKHAGRPAALGGR